MPEFSIILPVRNGGQYIKDCVQSIFSQEYTDFELLVLENGSTDGTAEWLQTIGDPRLKLFPARQPLTIEENWNRILHVEKSTFITLIGHDDILFPTYLKEMESLIRRYPEAKLYQTHFNYINSQGDPIRNCLPMREVEDAKGFLESCLNRTIDLMGTGFMMRAADYQAVGGIPMYPNLLFADFELWLNITKKGFKVTSMETCFSFRLHQSTTTTSGDDKMHKAFRQFITYLIQLGNENQAYQEVINSHAGNFLEHYCQGMVHRLLRTPVDKRNRITVRTVLNQFQEYAHELKVEHSFHPRRKWSIKAAIWIDLTALGRKLFLMIKRIFPKPLLH